MDGVRIRLKRWPGVDDGWGEGTIKGVGMTKGGVRVRLKGLGGWWMGGGYSSRTTLGVCVADLQLSRVGYTST